MPVGGSASQFIEACANAMDRPFKSILPLTRKTGLQTLQFSLLCFRTSAFGRGTRRGYQAL